MKVRFLQESNNAEISASNKRRLTDNTKGMDMRWVSDDGEWENSLESGAFHDDEKETDMNYVLGIIRQVNRHKSGMYAKKYEDTKEAKKDFEKAGKVITDPAKFQGFLKQNGFVRVSHGFLG